MRRRSFLAATAAVAAVGARRALADGVRMSMRVENNRVFAHFTYPGARGISREVLTQIDTGGGSLFIARKTVDALGLAPHSAAHSPGAMLVVDEPNIFAGGMAIPIGQAYTTAAETTVWHPGAASPAILAASFLANHTVTFDYSKGTFSLDGLPLTGGMPMTVGIHSRSKFPRVELQIDGETYGFLLDTGAAYSMLTQDVIDKLHAKHPDWAYVQGAYGPANMIGKGDLASHMLRIPSAAWGPFEIGPLGVVSRETRMFERVLGPWMTAPVAGSLGGNALRNFTLQIDYPLGMLNVLHVRRPWPQELTLVPLILQPRDDGTYLVAGGAASGGIAGAQLLAVEGAPVQGLALVQVQDMLRGPAGAARSVLVRDGRGTRTVRLRVANVW